MRIKSLRFVFRGPDGLRRGRWLAFAAAWLAFAAGPACGQLSLVNVAHTNNGGNAYALAVAGNRLYLANFDDGLRIYDISNPTNPVSIGHANNGGFASGLALSSNRLYLANFDDGLRVYDVSNPANPVSIGHTNTGASALGVAVAGNRAYVANNEDGLRIYDVSNPANPVNIGHGAGAGGNAFGVAVAGNFAFVANNLDGLRIYNVANPSNCVSVAVIQDGGIAFGPTLAGGLVYYANGSDGLRIYNVLDPANPVFLGHSDIPAGSAFGIAVTPAAAIVFLGNFDGGLRAFDVSTPSHPTSIAAINDGGLARGIAFSGSHVYLANGEDGLRVYLAVPQLKIKTVGGAAQLTWHGPATEFQLQESGNPAGPWDTVPAIPSFTASLNEVDAAAAPAARFYRLRYAGPRGPMLAIRQSASNTVSLSWSAAFAGFAVQQNTNLAATNWTAVTNDPGLVSGFNEVGVSPPAGRRFYRLVGP